MLPTGDDERYRGAENFQKLLKFSKEVQVYLDIGEPIGRYNSISGDELKVMNWREAVRSAGLDVSPDEGLHGTNRRA